MSRYSRTGNGHKYLYKDFVRESLSLEETYSPLLKRYVIGKSTDLRDIIMLRVGVGEKAIFCLGGVHGRESINPLVLMDMIDTYCRQYFHCSRKYDWVREFFLQYSIYFVPLVNPDGYMTALRGFESIHNVEYRAVSKALGIPSAEWKFNGRGVDINRNFPSATWKQGWEEDYPASEPETRALMDVFERIPSIGMIDYHSRGNVIYYYRAAMCSKYNKRQYKLAESLSNITGYELVPPEEEMDTQGAGGNTVHYYSEFIGQPAITIETVADEETFPLNPSAHMQVFNRIWMTPVQFMRDIIASCEQ